MGELYGFKKTLTRDGVGQVVNGFTPNPSLTNNISPVVIGENETYSLSVEDWTVIRFRTNQNVMITLYDEVGNKSMVFPESPNLPIIYILSYVVTIEFYNDGADPCTIWYQGT